MSKENQPISSTQDDAKKTTETVEIIKNKIAELEIRIQKIELQGGISSGKKTDTQPKPQVVDGIKVVGKKVVPVKSIADIGINPAIVTIDGKTSGYNLPNNIRYGGGNIIDPIGNKTPCADTENALRNICFGEKLKE